MRHLVDKVLHARIVVDVFELGGHGRRRHGGLFGRNGPMQQHDQDKGQGIVGAGGQASPKGRKCQTQNTEFDPSGQADDGTATQGFAQHAAVFCAIAGDVVFATFGAALGHFFGQHMAVGHPQAANAAAVMAHLCQVRHQGQHGGHGYMGEQGLHQVFAPDHQVTQLPQPKDNAHRNAVFLQV